MDDVCGVTLALCAPSRDPSATLKLALAAGRISEHVSPTVVRGWRAAGVAVLAATLVAVRG